MGAFTPLKIITTEGEIENVRQNLLKRYREGGAVCDPDAARQCQAWA